MKEHHMAITPIDPLAGIPIGTAKPARKVKGFPLVTSPTPVISLAAARATHKRRKLTGEQYKQARDTARAATGYGPGSVIWGRMMSAVLVDIETMLTESEEAILDGRYADANNHLRDALSYNQELQKRVATGALIAAQS
jgi:hypothetical protein